MTRPRATLAYLVASRGRVRQLIILNILAAFTPIQGPMEAPWRQPLSTLECALARQTPSPKSEDDVLPPSWATHHQLSVVYVPFAWLVSLVPSDD